MFSPFLLLFIVLFIITFFILSTLMNICMFPDLAHSYTKEDVDSPFSRFIDIEHTIGYFLFDPRHTFTILYSHGNGSDVGQQREWCWELFTTLRMNILCYDYVGYGLSISQDGKTNTPSEDGCYASAECAMKFLTQKKGIPLGRIIFLGHSLGTGVTCEMATRYETAGVLLMAPFTSAIGVLSPKLAKWVPLMDRMKSIDKVAKIKQPLQIIHGVRDEIISYHCALALQEQNPTNIKVTLIQDGYHNNLAQVASHEIYEALKSFTFTVPNAQILSSLFSSSATTTTSSSPKTKIIQIGTDGSSAKVAT